MDKPVTSMITEIGAIFDEATRFRSEMYAVNTSLVNIDALTTLQHYEKASNTFKKLKVLMLDLDRAIAKSAEISSPPETGP